MIGFPDDNSFVEPFISMTSAAVANEEAAASLPSTGIAVSSAMVYVYVNCKSFINHGQRVNSNNYHLCTADAHILCTLDIYAAPSGKYTIQH